MFGFFGLYTTPLHNSQLIIQAGRDFGWPNHQTVLQIGGNVWIHLVLQLLPAIVTHHQCDQCNEHAAAQHFSLLGLVLMLNFDYFDPILDLFWFSNVYEFIDLDQIIDDLHWQKHGKSWSHDFHHLGFSHWNSASPHGHLRNTQSHQRRWTLDRWEPLWEPPWEPPWAPNKLSQQWM